MKAMSYKRNGVILKMWCHTAVLAGVESQSRCGVDVASRKFFWRHIEMWRYGSVWLAWHHTSHTLPYGLQFSWCDPRCRQIPKHGCFTVEVWYHKSPPSCNLNQYDQIASMPAETWDSDWQFWTWLRRKVLTWTRNYWQMIQAQAGWLCADSVVYVEVTGLVGVGVVGFSVKHASQQ